jgi:hypothetical protein
MGANRDLYYKVAAEFSLNTNEIYKTWKQYYWRKKEGGMNTKNIIETVFENMKVGKGEDDAEEMMQFLTAFGLAVLTQEMER